MRLQAQIITKNCKSEKHKLAQVGTGLGIEVVCECKCHKDIGSGPRKAPEPTEQQVSQSSQVVNLNDYNRTIP